MLKAQGSGINIGTPPTPVRTATAEPSGVVDNPSSQSELPLNSKSKPRAFTPRWLFTFRGVPRPVAVLAWIIILSASIVVWADASRDGFVPCRANCGETFVALSNVDAFHTYGFRYGLVEIVGPAPDGGRPVLYTHNPNWGTMVFTLMEAVGLRSVWMKQLLTLAAFGLGLLYLFRAITYYTRSWLIGLSALLFFVTDYEYVFRFALNALRAWHWLALFGLVFHVCRLAREPRAHPIRDRLTIFLFGLMSLGIGYDFWVICAAVACLTLLSELGREIILSRRGIGLTGTLVAGFLVPLVLRQVQIMSVLGPAYWLRDLYYSAGIKVSVLGKFLSMPTLAQIDDFYNAEHVIRPPATPATSLGQIAGTFRDMVTFVTLPTAGLIAVAAACSLAALGIAGGLLSVCRPAWWAKLRIRMNMGATKSDQWFRPMALATILVGGSMLGLAVFAPLSLQIYLKHQFPLIAAPLDYSKGVLAALLLGAAWRWRHRLQTIPTLGAAALAAFLFVDQALVQRADIKNPLQPGVDMGWVAFVTGHPEYDYAVSGMPPSWVSPFASRLQFIPTDDTLLSHLRTANTTELHNYFQARAPEEASQPIYWLYDPADFTPQFDRPVPVCRQDYLTGAIGSLLQRPSARDDVQLMAVWPTVVRPGQTISVMAHVDAPGSSPHAELSADRGTSPMKYNCVNQMFTGTHSVPLDAQPGLYHFRVQVVGASGRPAPIPAVTVTVENNAPPSETPPLVTTQATVPTSDEMIADYPFLPVIARGAGFVIFQVAP